MEVKSTDTQIETWAVLELFGHSKAAGFVRSVPMGTSVMLRVDVPEVHRDNREWSEAHAEYRTVKQTIPAYTRYFNPSAVFSMTPCSEEVARRALGSFHIDPPAILALPAPTETGADGDWRIEEAHDDPPG